MEHRIAERPELGWGSRMQWSTLASWAQPSSPQYPSQGSWGGEGCKARGPHSLPHQLWLFSRGGAGERGSSPASWEAAGVPPPADLAWCRLGPPSPPPQTQQANIYTKHHELKQGPNFCLHPETTISEHRLKSATI